MQDAAESCRACGGASLQKPAELMRRRRAAPLEILSWRSMPAPLLLSLLAALGGIVLFGPALARVIALALTGSALVAELVLVTAMLVPSARLLFRAELPASPVARLSPARPLLLPGGVARRGRVRARERC